MNVKTKKAVRNLGLALALCSCATAAFAGNVKKPYMIYEGDNTTMTVLWQDNATETTNTITWGTDPTFTTNLGSATVLEFTPSLLAPALYTHQHKYQITGLTPSTKYYYQVADATNGVYGTGSFVTAPAASATAVKFLGFGDTRSQPNVMEEVIQEMRKVYAADPAYQSITLQAGDWVHTDGETAWGNSTNNIAYSATAPYGVNANYEWFNTDPQTQALLTETPINGVKGNHENNGGYSQFFPKYYPYPYPNINTVATGSATDPKSNNLYWSFNYGPVHFTLVDQYTEYCFADQPNTSCATTHANSAQYDWVANDLRTTTKPWKMLIYHEPTWGPGNHQLNYKTQVALDHLTQQYGVDMVYSGHNHNYGRAMVNTLAETKPISGATPQNTVLTGVQDTIAPTVQYVTIGGGGAGLYPVDLSNTGTGCGATPDTNPAYLPNNCFRHAVAGVYNYGYATFDVNDKNLTMKAYQIFHSDGVTPAAGPDILPQATTSSLIETVTLTHPTDISTLFGATTTGVGYSRISKQYTSTITITNISQATISVPLAALLNNLTPGVTLANASGSSNGSPFVAQATQDIAPGQSISIPLQFNNPSNLKITFTPAVIRQF